MQSYSKAIDILLCSERLSIDSSLMVIIVCLTEHARQSIFFEHGQEVVVERVFGVVSASIGAHSGECNIALIIADGAFRLLVSQC